MKIVEIEWLKLKQNIEKVSPKDIDRLTEIGVFRWITQGIIDNMPLPQFVRIIEEVSNIVNSYVEGDV